jgi:FKBP-type peptidyl-prolyl cis-trans isomerase FkpA
MKSFLTTATLVVALTSTFTACAENPNTPDPAAPAAGEKAAAPAAADKAAAPAAADKAAAPAAADAPGTASKETAKVNKTASGLQYEVLTEGSGAKPAATDSVTVHYRGTLTDGKEFDSSYKRGQPATFPLNRVIKGWTEGVQLMTVGSKYRFTIPPELGYGAAGVPGTIPPNSTLVFDVELIKIN